MNDSHLVTNTIVKEAIPEIAPDSHKGQNGKILIIAGSPLFHGSGSLSAKGALEIISVFASRTNDWVYICTSQENLKYLKERHEAFIGIGRGQIDLYLREADVVLCGPGLMREKEINFPETDNEPEITKELTRKTLASSKKLVLDAGSLQVISRNDLRGKTNIIITPHQKEMAKLFDIEVEKFQTKHNMSFSEISKIGEFVKSIAEKYKITILLKGPIDIIADSTNWMYTPGGDSGMTKGGTGDVLAGITAAIYSRTDSPILAAATASYINKKAGEMLAERYNYLYN